MVNWIMEWMESYGYIGILLMIAIENLFPPIPSEVVLTFGGFMTTYTSMTIFGVVVASTVGSVLGAVILYGVGLILHVDRLEAIIERWGSILRLKKEDLYRANAWFDKYGYRTVFFCRMIPLLRSLISIPAGMGRMNFWLFLLFTTLGTLIWNVVLVSLGALLGDSWEDIVAFVDVYSNIAYALIALCALVVVVLWLRRKKA